MEALWQWFFNVKGSHFEQTRKRYGNGSSTSKANKSPSAIACVALTPSLTLRSAQTLMMYLLSVSAVLL
ncbi:hypothetical protein V3C99_011672 [Haemonchus contortus]|uniref:Ovule protein n=1 Tax=Haemonchus contortus TaxID=6289 RepID=A0A7I4Y4U2_HAECO|nr:unnamed protein product [Haemonchus contortus]